MLKLYDDQFLSIQRVSIFFYIILWTYCCCCESYAIMADPVAEPVVSVSVIANPNPLPECEMDALLLGRTKVSNIQLKSFEKNPNRKNHSNTRCKKPTV